MLLSAAIGISSTGAHKLAEDTGMKFVGGGRVLSGGSRKGLSTGSVAIVGALLTVLSTFSDVHGQSVSDKPRIQCNERVPAGVRRFRFPTHIEIVGEVLPNAAPYEGGSGTMRQRYALIRGTNCFVSFVTYSRLEDEASLPATGSFVDLNTLQLGKSKPLWVNIADKNEVFAHISADYRDCSTLREARTASLPKDFEMWSPEQAAIAEEAGRDERLCKDRAVDAINGRGFVGIWASGSPAPRNAFTFVDGKLTVWGSG